MRAKVKKKLCWNCEGTTPLETENCPYCGVYLNPLLDDDEKDSLFSPPYRVEEVDDPEIPSAPYPTQDADPANLESTQMITDTKIEEVAKSPLLPTELAPLLLLLSGSVLFLFGIALSLFSHHGILSLQWNGSYWYLYFLFSIPLLIMGWRTLQQEKL